MQSRPEIESDNHQIREEDVHIPYRKVFGLIVISLILQAGGTLAAASYVGKTNAAQLLDIGTMLAIVVFVCGALMWGRFPGAEEPFVDHMDKDRSRHGSHEMSVTNMVRGAVLMISSVLYVLGCIGVNWVAGMFV
jgi:hypothetical protein